MRLAPRCRYKTARSNRAEAKGQHQHLCFGERSLEEKLTGVQEPTKPPMPTEVASVQASANAVHSNLGGSMSERTSVPEDAKSSHMRMTSQDTSERRQKERDGL